MLHITGNNIFRNFLKIFSLFYYHIILYYILYYFYSISPRRSSKKGDGEVSGIGSEGDEVFCSFTNGRKKDSEKDCACIIN